MSAVEKYEFLVSLLFAVVVLELLARRARLPPAAAFITGGALLAVLPGVPVLSIDPNLVLLVFLPPLLMNGGYLTAWAEFRVHIWSISLLAVGAVVFTTTIVGLVAKFLLPDLPWAVCFVLGAIVSPPDAVAAGAILERLSLPRHLIATLQGESLLNDASGLVLFRFAVAAALTGSFSLTGATTTFVILTVGGIGFGWLVGLAGIMVLRRLQDSELAIITTLLLPSLAYIGGERIHVSGVLATVTAGILIGRRQHGILSAATRIRAQAFWKVLVFLLESILFILIGLAIHDILVPLERLQHAGRELWEPVGGVIVATIAARFIWMFGTYAGRRIAHGTQLFKEMRPPSLAVATIMGWAGMRGVVTLAAALSLPASMPGRNLILISAFGVILVTVLLQGTTLAPLIRILGISGTDEFDLHKRAGDRAWSSMMAAQYRAIAELSRMPDGSERHPRLLEQYGRRAKLAESYISDRDTHHTNKLDHHTAVLHAIEAGRAELLRLHAAGDIHDQILRTLGNPPVFNGAIW
jgi:Na+/H+ antiporter